MFTKETIYVHYVYEAVMGKVTVNYRHTDGETLIKSITLTGEIGTRYKAPVEEIPGYTLLQLEGSEIGEFHQTDQEVTCVYKRKASTVTVKYVNVEGKEIAPSETISRTIDSPYKTSAKEIDGYLLDGQPDNGEGLYTIEPIEVVYRYKVAKGRVTIVYVDTAGKALLEPIIKTGDIGSTYTSEAKAIKGYVLKEIPVNVNGIFTKEDITVAYIYEEAPQRTVLVRYIDWYGNQVAWPIVKTGDIGESYTTQPAEVHGYILDITPENAEGVFTENDIVVDYIYEELPKGKVTVKHINAAGEELLVTMDEGYIGDSYTTQAINIAGYTLLETPANASGVYTKEEIIVIYRYD